MAKVEVELIFPKELTHEPVIYQIVKNFEIIPTIIEASFSTDMGWAYLILEGKEKELARLFEYLKEKRVTVNKR